MRTTRTPAPVPATAPAEQVSSARALVHVREYLLAQLRALGLDPQVHEATAVGTRSPTAGRLKNVLARLPGRVPGGPALLIDTQHDGVPSGPAARDDAAGSAALLETLRALWAGPPLEHHEIALFSDAEEIGLHGAAAVVREHPWAKGVAVTTNVRSARLGRAVEHVRERAGNRDAVRVLSTLGHVTHYGVVHVSEGSLEHQGAQMLALARAFGNGPLPRPLTADVVFYYAPLIGIVSYPESWSVPRTLAVTGLSAFGGSQLGSWILGLHTTSGWEGAPEWRSVYAAVLAIASTVRLREVGFLFAGPLAAVTLAALVSRRAPDAPSALVATSIVTSVAAALEVPVIHTTGAYALPLDGRGALVIGAFVPMLEWLIAPIVEGSAGGRRFRTAGAQVAASPAPLSLGMAHVRRSVDRPTTEDLTDVTSIDTDSARLVAPASDLRDGSFSPAALGPSPGELKGEADTSLAWAHATLGSSRASAIRPAPRTITDAPDVTIVTDSVVGDRRRRARRFTALAGTWVRAAKGEPFVRLLAHEGRVVDRTRFRGRPRGLAVRFAAPPDAGFTGRIELLTDSVAALRVPAVITGLPDGLADIAARPEGVGQIASVDVAVRHRMMRLPQSTPLRPD
jgi:hypothetical protein